MKDHYDWCACCERLSDPCLFFYCFSFLFVAALSALSLSPVSHSRGSSLAVHTTIGSHSHNSINHHSPSNGGTEISKSKSRSVSVDQREAWGTQQTENSNRNKSKTKGSEL